MGLDMYFTAKKWEGCSRYDGNKKLEYDPELSWFDAYILDRSFKSVETKYKIGYFRKFNALHKYIVDNFADGIDDCKPVWLGEDYCKQILEVLKSVTKENAAEVLPTGSGCFFGSIEYDDWYFEDVKDAIELFEKIVALLSTEHCRWDIFYEASW